MTSRPAAGKRRASSLPAALAPGEGAADASPSSQSDADATADATEAMEPTASDSASTAAPTAPARAPAAAVEATPSMAQFLEIKAANSDSLLWYRMGDFYELFFDDAVVASEALGIVLTKRGKHLGQDIPMCGVPIHRADDYLQKLIRLGHRVAVCEQLEDPAEARKRGSKAVVRRDVVRLVTAGTLTEETLLEPGTRNYLAAVYLAPGGTWALAALDISTGEFEVGEVAAGDLSSEFARLAPSEIVASDATFSDPLLAHLVGARNSPARAPVAAAFFDSMSGERTLKAYLGVADLQAFGGFSRHELAVTAALLKYVELTQIGRKPVLRPPRRLGAGAGLIVDAASRASLELVRSTSGDKAGSLLSAIDRTVTGAGARELAARLSSPLSDATVIRARLDALSFLVSAELFRADVRSALRRAPDVARALSRLAFQRGGPRDLAAVRDALAVANKGAGLLTTSAGALGLPAELAAIVTRLAAAPEGLEQRLVAALVDDPPHLKRDGGFVRPGYSAELDAALAMRDDSRRVMAALEARYVAETGVKQLKVRHNNILGYFIEVTQTTAKPLLSPPLSETFRHRQTMANAVRFTTLELVDIEGRMASAGTRAVALEQDIFAELSTAVLAAERALGEVASALAELDVLAALAELAVDEGYVRPEVDHGTALVIEGGRHPVVEMAMRARKEGAFIDNDCMLGDTEPATVSSPDELAEPSGAPSAATSPATARLWLVTGPNMAGKSTFLRQNALIVVLAQMGSFVPARRARIGVVDRLFSRVGAADDLARGRSTFMVEMVETAGILNQATPRSLVILDEIGRGTATFDGLSIAWAAVEYLHEVTRCRALFATHYHELTVLAGRLAHVANVTIEVKEWHEDIVFLHKVKAGAADRSYGIQVARLAGLPRPVVDRAREVLTMLEEGKSRAGAAAAPLDDLPLFAAARAASPPAPPTRSAIDDIIDGLRPDDLTPRAALDVVYRLKELRRPGA